MDIHRPVIDGLKSTGGIREYEAYKTSGPPPAIIVMTSKNEQSDHEIYLKSGLSGITTKPLAIENVVTLIREIITNFSD